MKVLITGTSRGIGRAAALKFLSEGFNVIGLDIESDTISKSHDAKNKENYSHFTADISAPSSLPGIPDVEILVNNAGIQTPALTGGEKDIQVNLIGTMAVTQKYAFQPKIKSVLFNASVSALTGNEFPSYAASKAGIIGYMKNCAIRLANSYRATCNALCFGGVMTELNEKVIKNNELWQKIMDATPLKRWASAQEAADWIYFLTVINKFCTGQAIDVSGGERNCADLFVW